MLADIIVTIHFLYVSFIIGGLLSVWVGAFFKWQWIRNFWFRILHLAAIGFVAAESVFGIICPLTEWENNLRRSTGGTYHESFIQHWVHKLLFYQAPEIVFTVSYILFTLLVMASLVWIRPRRP